MSCSTNQRHGTSTSDNSIPISEDKVSDAEVHMDEEEIGALEESSISF